MYDNIKDEIFDGILKAAFYDYAAEMIAGEPSEEILAEMYPISARGMKKLKRIIRQKKHRRPLYEVYLRRAAVILLTAVTVLFGALLTNGQVRAAVRDAVIEWYDKYIRFNFLAGDTENEAKTAAEPVDINSFRIGYIPEGFELVDENEGRHREYTYFDSEGGRIFIDIHNSGLSESLNDIEYHQLDEITINDYKAYVVIRNNDHNNVIVFGNSDFFVSVTTSLDIDKARKIAENIK